MKKIERVLFCISTLGFIGVFIAFSIFMIEEVWYVPSSVYVSVSFLFSLMLVTLYPIFLVFAAFSGMLEGWKITFSSLAVFMVMCFFFLAANHCLGVALNNDNFPLSQVFQGLLDNTVIMSISIVLSGFFVSMLRYFRLIKIKRFYASGLFY